MSFGPYFRHVGEHNAGEFEKVLKSMEVWGTDAKCLAHGLRVQAVPISRARSDDGYNFLTESAPRESLGFTLDGQTVVREVYWDENTPGVEYRDNEKYLCIQVHTIRKGRN